MRYTEDTCKLIANFVSDLDAEYGNERPNYSFSATERWDKFQKLRLEMKREEGEWRTPRAMRERQGLTIEDCAMVNGVSAQTWAAWERGEVKKMQPIEEKVTPLVERAARHFFDGQVQVDLEDLTDEVAQAS